MILLDTNALLWVYEGRGQLGDDAMTLIRSGRPVCFSSVSVTEIVIKHMLGKVASPGAMPDVFLASGLRELALTSAHASAMAFYPDLVRHDPFDRMLLAQARAEGCTLVTSDRGLLGLGEDWIVDARA